MNVFKKDQVYELLRERILLGAYADGMKLPPEADFAQELKVGKITLRSALARLEEERLISRVRGRGTFVSFAPEQPSDRSVIMVHNLQQDGRIGHFVSQMFPHFHRCSIELHLNEIFMTAEQIGDMSPAELKAFAGRANAIGFFLFSHGFIGQEPWLETIKQVGLPVILTNALNNDHDLTGCATVTTQQADGFRQAVRLLAECGYQRIGIIHPFTPYSGILLSLDAEQIIRECRSHGLECRRDRITACAKDRAAVERQITAWMQADDAPDALLLGFGDSSVFAVEAVRQSGRQIGREVGLIARTNHESALAVDGITTLGSDLSGLTRKAYRLLQEADSWYPPRPGQPVPDRYHFFRLTPRASTRSPLPL